MAGRVVIAVAVSPLDTRFRRSFTVSRHAMNVLLVVQITGYVLALILALCVGVPVVVHQKDFK